MMDAQNAQSKRELGRRRGSNSNKKALKVVYISSPMKVKTCASRFRALVQELTGKDSDTARLMDVNGGEYSPTVSEQGPVDDREMPSGKEELLPADSLFGERDENHNFLVPQMDESFYEMLPSNLFIENSQFDALRCFGGP